MTIEAIKKLLTETVGEEEATKVAESLEKYTADLAVEHGKATKLKVDEAVNELKVTLETQYLTKLDEHKAEADKKITEEVAKYESALAKRVKTVLEQAVSAHGDKLVQVAKENEVAKGSKLLKEVAALVAEANEETKVDETTAEQLKALQTELAQVKESLEAEKKKVMEATARKNVAEQNLKQIKESLETSIQVTVTEEKTKTKSAAEEQTIAEAKEAAEEQVQVQESAEQKTKLTPEMSRMRRLAGIK